MLYFNSFPKIVDFNNVILTNLMKRVDIIPSLLKNPLLFYTYDIQEGDTPDIVANKYYGNSYRYWITLLSNEALDPQWNWPLNSKQFNDYLISKYSDAAAAAHIDNVITYTQSAIHEYRLNILTIDGLTQNQTTRIIVIDEYTYNTTVPGTTTQIFQNGITVTQITSLSAINIYDWELQQNEAKRSISLINSIYASELESQFATLIGK
jgi:asparagine N-glycosylation enzyme membrane subunit Stt3